MEKNDDLIDVLKEQNQLLKRQIKDNNNFWMIVFRGMLMGLGSAIGATVILSLAIYLLKPLQEIQPIKPAIERLVETLDKLERSRGQGTIRQEKLGETDNQGDLKQNP